MSGKRGSGNLKVPGIFFGNQKKGQEASPGNFWFWLIGIFLSLIVLGVLIYFIVSRMGGVLK